MQRLPEITSPTNPLVKEIHALRLRKRREETGLFAIEGLRNLEDALARGAAPVSVLLGDAALEAPACNAVVRRTVSAGADVYRVSQRVLEKLSHQANAQPAIATFRQHWCALQDAPVAPRSLWVALEGARDPGNLGTILRTATAAGACGLIQLDGGCDPFSPEAVRASMGTIFAQRLVRAGLRDFADWCRGRGAVLVAADPRGDRDFMALEYRLPAVVLMGSEGEGLSEAALALADMRAAIPMRPEAESLNVAVSTALMLYAVVARCGLADPSG